MAAHPCAGETPMGSAFPSISVVQVDPGFDGSVGSLIQESATMYEGFFELHEKPFSLLPDPGFFYSSRKHQEALTLLEYGLLNQAGFIILTGEIGSGKTTLMRHIMEGLDKDVVIGLVSNTHQSLGDTMEWIGQAFNLKPVKGSKLDLHRAFVDFLIH
jgi:hypothetical protein